MKVGVIGGGLGGLAAACTLAAAGIGVILLERNDWLGGKAAVLKDRGYRFDMGPTIRHDALGATGASLPRQASSLKTTST